MFSNQDNTNFPLLSQLAKSDALVRAFISFVSTDNSTYLQKVYQVVGTFLEANPNGASIVGKACQILMLGELKQDDLNNTVKRYKINKAIVTPHAHRYLHALPVPIVNCTCANMRTEQVVRIRSRINRTYCHKVCAHTLAVRIHEVVLKQTGAEFSAPVHCKSDAPLQLTAV